jgi:hypothetical protein
MAKKIRSLILVFVIFLTFCSTLIQASEIKEVRYYSDKEKTRIVLQLNELTQYKTNYDKDNSLNISILKSEIGTSKNIFKIDDGLVNSLELRKTNEDNININISINRPATFNVFPLESPARIVIDVSPFENIIAPEVVAISDQDIDDFSQNSKESQIKTINYNSNETQKPISEESIENIEQLNKASNLPFDIPVISSLINDNRYGFIQIGFDIIVIISLLYMISKMKESFRIVRLLKKNRKLFKENPIFADILEEIEKGTIKEKKKKKTKSTDIDEENDIQELRQKNINEVEKEITFPKQYDKVQEFAQKGMDPISIAQKSDIPVGEVNLILDLIKARKENHATK